MGMQIQGDFSIKLLFSSMKLYSSSSIVLFFNAFLLLIGISEALVRLPKNVTIPAVIVFGDSIVDQGNNNDYPTVAKANFPPYGKDFKGGIATGRYSNGKTPPDLIAEELGITELVPAYLDPNLRPVDLLTGVSFASGASGFDPQTSQILGYSLTDQLKMFKEYTGKLKEMVGEERTNFILDNSIYLVVTGTNDIATTYYTMGLRRLQYDIDAYTDFLVQSASDFMKELYDLRARRVAVFGVPPIGCVPSQRTFAGGLERVCVETYNEASQMFNTKLSNALTSLNNNVHDSKARLVYVDIYNPLMDIIQHHDKYGFTVADRGCCGTGIIEVILLCNRLTTETCPDDSKYLFWDSFHPTERGYRVLINRILGTIISKFF